MKKDESKKNNFFYFIFIYQYINKIFVNNKNIKCMKILNKIYK